jgi:hypothetical protein
MRDYGSIINPERDGGETKQLCQTYPEDGSEAAR